MAFQPRPRLRRGRSVGPRPRPDRHVKLRVDDERRCQHASRYRVINTRRDACYDFAVRLRPRPWRGRSVGRSVRGRGRRLATAVAAAAGPPRLTARHATRHPDFPARPARPATCRVIDQHDHPDPTACGLPGDDRRAGTGGQRRRTDALGDGSLLLEDERPGAEGGQDRSWLGIACAQSRELRDFTEHRRWVQRIESSYSTDLRR